MLKDAVIILAIAAGVIVGGLFVGDAFFAYADGGLRFLEKSSYTKAEKKLLKKLKKERKCHIRINWDPVDPSHPDKGHNYAYYFRLFKDDKKYRIENEYCSRDSIFLLNQANTDARAAFNVMPKNKDLQGISIFYETLLTVQDQRSWQEALCRKKYFYRIKNDTLSYER